MKDLRLWANYYYNMGFNITHIIAKQNQNAKNPYKSATNNRFVIQNMRQEFSEMQKYDWENSDGIGVVLGFNNLRAIDFDFSRWDNNVISTKRNEIIKICLQKLQLPEKYEWVIITPNGGFHILFFSGTHNIPVRENLTRAFIPNIKYHHYCDEYDIPAYYFKQIELRWEKHLVLPPSRVEIIIYKKDEKSGNGIPVKEFNSYEFYSKNVPLKLPLEVSLNNIQDLLNEICYDEYDHSSKSGYNLHLSNYYEDNDEEGIKFYEEGEFLDLSPVYFKMNSKE